MTVAATAQEKHIYYAICCLPAQQEESLASKQCSDELSGHLTIAYRLSIVNWDYQHYHPLYIIFSPPHPFSLTSLRYSHSTYPFFVTSVAPVPYHALFLYVHVSTISLNLGLPSKISCYLHSLPTFILFLTNNKPNCSVKTDGGQAQGAKMLQYSYNSPHWINSPWLL